MAIVVKSTEEIDKIRKSSRIVAEVLEEMGAEHVPCPVDDIVVDEDNKIVTTPAYMLAQNIAEAASGIDKLVSRVLVLAE